MLQYIKVQNEYFSNTALEMYIILSPRTVIVKNGISSSRINCLIVFHNVQNVESFHNSCRPTTHSVFRALLAEYLQRKFQICMYINKFSIHKHLSTVITFNESSWKTKSVWAETLYEQILQYIHVNNSMRHNC